MTRETFIHDTLSESEASGGIGPRELLQVHVPSGKHDSHVAEAMERQLVGKHCRSCDSSTGLHDLNSNTDSVSMTHSTRKPIVVVPASCVPRSCAWQRRSLHRTRAPLGPRDRGSQANCYHLSKHTDCINFTTSRSQAGKQTYLPSEVLSPSATVFGGV